jgi:hypothetical protein
MQQQQHLRNTILARGGGGGGPRRRGLGLGAARPDELDNEPDHLLMVLDRGQSRKPGAAAIDAARGADERKHNVGEPVGPDRDVQPPEPPELLDRCRADRQRTQPRGRRGVAAEPRR